MARVQPLLIISLFFASIALVEGHSQAAKSLTSKANSQSSDGASLLIRLEQKKAEQVTIMRPGHVFEQGDVVRFRLTSGLDGYLYVVNHGSSGSYSPLFPAPATRADNHIEKASDYLVPSSEDGWFQIEGPAGFEVVYFLLSGTPLNIPAWSDKAPLAPSDLPGSLTPRCNDAVFKARGECVDDSAGPAALPRGAPLPPQIGNVAPLASRDIVFTDGEEENSVRATPAGKGTKPSPIVYTFRLAHH